MFRTYATDVTQTGIHPCALHRTPTGTGGDVGVWHTRAMHPGFVAAGIALALVVASLIVHLALTLMARRGWVHYGTTDRPRPTSPGHVEEVSQPSTVHVTHDQASEANRADQTGSDDEDEPGIATSDL